jgi:hypothetical protein
MVMEKFPGAKEAPYVIDDDKEEDIDEDFEVPLSSRIRKRTASHLDSLPLAGKWRAVKMGIQESQHTSAVAVEVRARSSKKDYQSMIMQ